MGTTYTDSWVQCRQDDRWAGVAHCGKIWNNRFIKTILTRKMYTITPTKQRVSLVREHEDVETKHGIFELHKILYLTFISMFLQIRIFKVFTFLICHLVQTKLKTRTMFMQRPMKSLNTLVLVCSWRPSEGTQKSLSYHGDTRGSGSRLFL